MTEYRASGARLAGAAAGVVVFLFIGIAATELGALVRGMQLMIAAGLAFAVIATARTRVIVGADEIAIKRLGKWFRASPADVKVTWRPILAGLGRRNGWALTVVRKRQNDDGVTLPMSFFGPQTIEALRTDLRNVTGSADA